MWQGYLAIQWGLYTVVTNGSQYCRPPQTGGRFVQLYSTLCTSMNDDDGAHVMVHLLHDCLPCRHACLTTLHPRLWQPHIPDLGDTTQTLRNLEYNVYIHEQWPWYTCYMIAHLLPAWELYLRPRPCQSYTISQTL